MSDEILFLADDGQTFRNTVKVRVANYPPTALRVERNACPPLHYNDAHTFMTLTSGAKLGPYEILSLLGAGGMGEVYRARDTRLDRIVAVKILPAHLSSDNEFKQRFEREARTVSSLNHPHICQLFDVGRDGSTDYLVMEFLDGETLAERVRRGALALSELLKIGIDVADALAVAHRAGIVHRDLKPGNIMLTKSGAKLMDFGLAKPALAGAPGSASAPLLSAARTMSGPSPASPLTTAGSIVGTIQYMSPEQIEGGEADAASDIFAFGAVLYEMTTGRRAFEGKSQITVASAILEKNPEPISTVKPLAPVALDQLVATCLAKGRDERFQSAHDLALQLKGITHAPQAPTSATQEAHTKRSWLMLAVAAALLIAAALFFYFSQRGSTPMLSVRAYIPPPAGTAFRPTGFDAGPVAVSPDGKTLAFSAVDEKGITNLWVRSLDAAQATMLQGTEDATYPFWSPDNKYLGFVADRKLKKIAVTGGEAQTLADHAEGRGEWGADGTILFVDDHRIAIKQVSAAGGNSSTAMTHGSDEYGVNSAWFLPDGKHFLYTGYRANAPSRIKVGTLGKPDSSVAVTEGAAPKFSSGHLLFVRSGKILAQPFDPDTFKLSGDPEVLGEANLFSVSPSGVLAYHESSANSELKIFDRSGNVVATPGPLAAYHSPRFSPDGKSISADVRDPKTGKDDVWIYPVAGGQPTRITFGPDDYRATWSPDGREIAYAVHDGNKLSIHKRPLDGSRPDETLYETADFVGATVQDWSPDGKYLSLDLLNKDLIYRDWILPLAGKREPFLSAATIATDASQYDGHFSPDSRWLSYFSYESGRPEVYVVPFQSNGVKYQASTTGGWVSRFAGNEFFFVTMGNRLMAARVVTQPNFHLEDLHPLFQLDLPNFTDPIFDVTRDGQRFVVLTADRAKTSSITLLTNWTAALNK
jgi:serine/threonine protein kinase